MKFSVFFKIFRIALLGLKHRMKPTNFLLMMCVFVSICTSILAVILKYCVAALEKYFFDDGNFIHVLGFKSLMPFIGIGISTVLIRFVYKQHFVKGNDRIIHAIAKKSSNLPFSMMYSPLITSGITVGLGGSAGLESPIVAAGSAIGANWGRATYLTQKEKTLLIGCGAASGIATAFSAPVAGVLFALEVLMIDLSIVALVPLLFSAATGALIARATLGSDILLSFNQIQPFQYEKIGYYILIGLATGFISVYYAKCFEWLEDLFQKVPSITKKWLWGSCLFGVLIFFFPPVLGEGYSFIKVLTNSGNIENPSFFLANAHNPWFLLLFLLAISLLKVFATGFTLLSGGNGGSFAPSLFIGAVIGFIVGRVAQLGWHADIPMTNFVVAGMAGTLCGIFYAPLMSIFLSAEITNGYSLMVPLMIVVGTSYLVVKAFSPLPLELKKLKKTTALDPMDKDHFLLSRLELSTFIRKTYPYFYNTTPVGDILKKVCNDSHEIFGIIDLNKKYLGVITLKELNHLLIEDDVNITDATAKDIMEKVKPLLDKTSLSMALDVFESDYNHFDELPVIDKDGQFLGFVKESSILEMYRSEMRNGFA